MLTTKHMKNLGFRTGLKGTLYLRAVVDCILDQPKNPRPKLITEVYPAVAEEFGVTVAAIDKGIRHAIANCNDNSMKNTPSDVIWELVERYLDGEFDE